jgi:hypothetical protein
MTSTPLKLFVNHYLCVDRTQPILLSADGCSGPFSLNAKPADSDWTYYEIALRAAAGEPLSDDPDISVEPGMNRIESIWAYLKIRDEQVAHAKLIMKLVALRDSKHEKAEA